MIGLAQHRDHIPFAELTRRGESSLHFRPFGSSLQYLLRFDCAKIGFNSTRATFSPLDIVHRRATLRSKRAGTSMSKQKWLGGASSVRSASSVRVLGEGKKNYVPPD